MAGDWKATALQAEEVWVETVTEDGRGGFMAAWRKEEVDAARHRQERRDATGLGKLLLLFLTFSVLVANPREVLCTVANPARSWSAERERENRTKKSGSPPPP